MGWQIGFDTRWNRDIGYGVPATCDFPGCGAEIRRGLAFVCGGEPFGGEHGCGLFFCGEHFGDLCDRCENGQPPYEPTPDTAEWLEWKLSDGSWATWRMQNPDAVERAQRALATANAGR